MVLEYYINYMVLECCFSGSDDTALDLDLASQP